MNQDEARAVAEFLAEPYTLNMFDDTEVCRAGTIRALSDADLLLALLERGEALGIDPDLRLLGKNGWRVMLWTTSDVGNMSSVSASGYPTPLSALVAATVKYMEAQK